jgi:hypothetical protein
MDGLLGTLEQLERYDQNALLSTQKRPKKSKSRRLSAIQLTRKLSRKLTKLSTSPSAVNVFTVSKQENSRPADDPSSLRLVRAIQRFQIVSAMYALLVLLGVNKSISVCPRTIICSNGVAEMILLLTARVSAYYDT